MTLPENIICIDIETTGPDKKLGSIVQLSAVVVDKEFNLIHAREFNSLIKPLNSFRDQRAMKTHGHSENELKTAPILEEVLTMFESFCDTDRLLASWGNYFDIDYLEEQYKKIYRKYPFKKRSMDLKSIAIWEMSKRNIPISSGIKRFLQALNRDFDGIEHNAIDDIKNTVELLRILRESDKK